MDRKEQKLVEVQCRRCCGQGGYEGWPGYVCFDCGGTGKRVVTARAAVQRQSRVAKSTNVRCDECGVVSQAGVIHKWACSHAKKHEYTDDEWELPF